MTACEVRWDTRVKKKKRIISINMIHIKYNKSGNTEHD